MRFNVVSSGSRSCSGDLFYTVPSDKEIIRAERDIYQRCLNRLHQIGEDSSLHSQFEIEYDMMQKTKSAFSFLLVKEISDLSQEHNYPIMLEGEIFGSIIPYLMGITSINPQSFLTKGCPIERSLIWFEGDNPKEPDFSFQIAKPIRPLIHRRLNQAFSQLESDDSAYKHIDVTDSDCCKQIGCLKELTNASPMNEQYPSEIYLCVLNHLADDLKSAVASSEKPHCSGMEERNNLLYFSEQLKHLDSCDFQMLIRAYGYTHGLFADKKTVENLYDDNYFVLRDEMYAALVRGGVPTSKAAYIVKHGIWSRGSEHQKYSVMLKGYGVPLTVIQQFDKSFNLWPAASCASRLQMLCTLAWYQFNYAEAFFNVTLKKHI